MILCCFLEILQSQPGIKIITGGYSNGKLKMCWCFKNDYANVIPELEMKLIYLDDECGSKLIIFFNWEDISYYYVKFPYSSK